MKKRVVWSIVLILLPLLTVGLAAMPDSVTAVVSKTEIVRISFFQSLPDGSYPPGLAFSGFLCCVTALLAILYGILRKRYWLTGVVVTAFASTFLSVLPLILRSQPPVVPHVGVAIAMAVECVIAYFCRKSAVKGTGKEESAGPRLDRP